MAGDGSIHTHARTLTNTHTHTALVDWHSVYAARADGSVNVTQMSQKPQKRQLPPSNDTDCAVCCDGAQVQMQVHAYCHNVGMWNMPYPPGAKLPQPIRDMQARPVWKDAYGIRCVLPSLPLPNPPLPPTLPLSLLLLLPLPLLLSLPRPQTYRSLIPMYLRRMPKDLLGMYEQMGEGLGIFHRVELISAVLGDGDLPLGLEAGLCARPLSKGREVKIDVSPRMALMPEPAQGWTHREPPRENPFPVSYLVKVLSVQARHDLPARQRLDSALIRRRRANVCYARALSLLPSSSAAGPTSNRSNALGRTLAARDEASGPAGALLQEACDLYEQALDMARLPPQAVLNASDPVAPSCLLAPLAPATATILKLVVARARLLVVVRECVRGVNLVQMCGCCARLRQRMCMRHMCMQHM